MNDEGIRDAIEAELKTMGVGKGCFTIAEKKREFVITALVNGEVRTVTIPERSYARTVKERLRELAVAPVLIAPAPGPLLDLMEDT